MWTPPSTLLPRSRSVEPCGLHTTVLWFFSLAEEPLLSSLLAPGRLQVLEESAAGAGPLPALGKRPWAGQLLPQHSSCLRRPEMGGSGWLHQWPHGCRVFLLGRWPQRCRCLWGVLHLCGILNSPELCSSTASGILPLVLAFASQSSESVMSQKPNCCTKSLQSERSQAVLVGAAVFLVLFFPVACCGLKTSWILRFGTARVVGKLMGWTSCSGGRTGCGWTGEVGLGELGCPHHSREVGARDAGKRGRPDAFGTGGSLLWWHEGQGCLSGGKTPPARPLPVGKAGPFLLRWRSWAMCCVSYIHPWL